MAERTSWQQTESLQAVLSAAYIAQERQQLRKSSNPSQTGETRQKTTPELTPQELQDYREAFNLFDFDNSGACLRIGSSCSQWSAAGAGAIDVDELTLLLRCVAIVIVHADFWPQHGGALRVRRAGNGHDD